MHDAAEKEEEEVPDCLTYVILVCQKQEEGRSDK